MSTFAKNLFSFSQSRDKDSEIANRISRIQALVRDVERQRHHELPHKIKSILDIAFNDQPHQSLFSLVYKSSAVESPVEWVPMLGKVLSLFSFGSGFMKLVLQGQDYKILIEKTLIPNYLFKNNLLNQKTGYQSISSSISGMMVSLLDYVFIRLLHAIYSSSFIESQKKADEQFQSDDFFFYISRNPYLLLLKNYLDFFSNTDKNLSKLIGDVKMFFVDQLLLKHRINKSTSYLKEFTFLTPKYKLKPQHLLVVFLLLQKERTFFEERNLFFYELVERFNSLVENQNQIFFRFLFRLFLFAYSKNSIENKVINLLQKANPQDGFFQLQRYSTADFSNSIIGVQKKDRAEFNQTKALLLKLLEKDQNLGTYNRVNFSIIRTLCCFLHLQIRMNSGITSSYGKQKPEDTLRASSEASSLQIIIEKLYRSAKSFTKRQNLRSTRELSLENEQKLFKQFDQITDLFSKAYNRKIDYKNFQQIKESTINKTFNTKGVNEDFTLSVETYKQDIAENCWRVPLKDSEYQILYDIFYSLAKSIDKWIPGHKSDQQPRVNLRYFSNPIVFMFVMIFFVILVKLIL